MTANASPAAHDHSLDQHQPHDHSARDHVDILVVGGGAAGLSAALVLARSRRSVVLVDAGEQRNAPADHMHNYLGRESTPPLELAAIGRAEVEQYGARVVPGRVTALDPVGGDVPSFVATLEDGSTVVARRVVLATGVVDELPDVPGLAERWGRDVLHCPYCHGWEVRDRRIGVLQTSAVAMHQVGLFRQLSDDVVLLANGHEPAHGGQRERLHARGVRIVEPVVSEVLVEGDALVGVRTADGVVVDLDALVVASVPHAGNALSRALGVAEKPIEMDGVVMATSLEADPMTGATSVPGVHAAGNAGNPMATVIASAASGTQVGAAVNAMLVEEDTQAAVQENRLAMREPQAWDERYGGDTGVWSGSVNPQLPARVAGLAPGTAVDVGCGEGGDALWLAAQGWRTTGVDFSAAGLRRAEQHAAQAGVAVDWRVADARTWDPAGEQWDLVTMHYLHLPVPELREIVARLGDAVAPGGTVLVVGHHPDDVAASSSRPRDDMFLAEDLAPALVGDWDVRTEVADRTGTGAGAHVHVRDTVLVATRR